MGWSRRRGRVESHVPNHSRNSELPHFAFSVAVENGLVCVGADHGALYIVDGNDRSSPILLTDVRVNTGVQEAVALRSGICYTGGNRLSIIGVTNPRAPPHSRHPLARRRRQEFGNLRRLHLCEHLGNG